MKKPCIVIIGNEGNLKKPNGQVVRTRTVRKTIEKKYDNQYEIVFINTAGKNILNLITAINIVKKAERIIIMPGPRSIGIVLRYLCMLNVSNNVVHVAIGGWLPDCVNNRIIKYESRFRAVLVQTNEIKNRLEQMGFNNVVHFPNYREKTNECIEMKTSVDLPSKFVFYSRVTRDKGIVEAIEAVKIMINEGIQVSLDIFGPIDSDILSIIDEECKNIPQINYGGVLHSGEILSTLAAFDCMLFPTEYEGEGFPGAVLESLMAGVPVIATDWKYNSEIVRDGETGILCGKRSTENLLKAIKRLRSDSGLYRNICKGAFVEGQNYSEEKISLILFEAMGI